MIDNDESGGLALGAVFKGAELQMRGPELKG